MAAVWPILVLLGAASILVGWSHNINVSEEPADAIYRIDEVLHLY